MNEWLIIFKSHKISQKICLKRLNISRKVLSKEKQLLDVGERSCEVELIESLKPHACACVGGTE
jgi:hypothetical protein